MNEFLANNWFSIFTVIVLIGSGCFNYGVSKQRNAQTTTAVKDIKTAMQSESRRLEAHIEHQIEQVTLGIEQNRATLQTHVNNTEIHVSGMLLELLKTRHDFVVQQLSDARNDIQRIEQQIAKT